MPALVRLNRLSSDDASTLERSREHVCATRRAILALSGKPCRLLGVNQTDALTSSCTFSWELSDAERLQALADGMNRWVLDGIEHLCCLDAGHDGTHVCDCGASS